MPMSKYISSSHYLSCCCYTRYTRYFRHFCSNLHHHVTFRTLLGSSLLEPIETDKIGRTRSQDELPQLVRDERH